MSAPTADDFPCSSFDIEDMRESWWERLGQRLFFDHPQWWMGILRNVRPITCLPFTGLTIVTRFEHVQEVLTQEQVFQVPFGPRMTQLIAGPMFVLALQDSPEYQHQRRQIMQVFKLEDVPAIIKRRSAELSEEILATCNGRIDAIESLMTRVPTRLCREYYGVDVQDEKLFAQWLMAMSAYVFSPPSNPLDKPAKHFATARAAGNCVRELIDRSIHNAKRARDRSTTIIARLIDMQEKGKGDPSDELIRAELFGMLTGFVPTNTLASGNVLDTLLSRPDFMRQAQEAARADDDDLLWRCLYETLRFTPINPGPFRLCTADYTIADGSPRGKRIRARTRLLVSTQSAMFDQRAVVDPKTFNPDRQKHEYMVFGFGLHWCIGAFLAAAQITQTFKPLLKKRGLLRVDGPDGKLQRIGLMPQHLTVQFKP